MKMKYIFILLFATISFITLTGCEKENCHLTTITVSTLTGVPDKGTQLNTTGTWIATGEINTSGTELMILTPIPTSDVTTIDCELTLNASEGSMLLLLHCSTVLNTGVWHIASGTGVYTTAEGSGTLIMTFPPDVPTGVLSVETLKGKIHLDEE
jgi:hypothetical protein